MIDERALDFHGANPMTGYVQHVVNAAQPPEEAVLVPLRAVTGEIDVWRPAAPVLLHVAFRIAIDPAQHRRPWPGEREEAAAGALDALATVGLDLRLDAGKRQRCRPGLRW